MTFSTCPECGSSEIEILVAMNTLEEDGCICTMCGNTFDQPELPDCPQKTV